MDKIKEGIQGYFKEKPEGDTDLVDEVRQALCKVGLQRKIPEAFDADRFIIDAEGKHSDVQRYFLNRYWNQQLLAANVPSIEERYCLLPNGTIADWLNMFHQKVLPFVLENDLPVAFNNA